MQLSAQRERPGGAYAPRVLDSAPSEEAEGNSGRWRAGEPPKPAVRGAPFGQFAGAACCRLPGEGTRQNTRGAYAPRALRAPPRVHASGQATEFRERLRVRVKRVERTAEVAQADG